MIIKYREKILNTASLALDEAKVFTSDLITSNFSKLKQIVTIESHDIAEDITHYFLIPDIHNVGSYILQTHRVVPSSLSNNITQKKIFHLPSSSSLQELEDLVFTKEKSRLKKDSKSNTVISGTLDDVANAIDINNSKLTNGLWVVGGIICLANPITGMAVIGASLMPNIVNHVISRTAKNIANSLESSAQEKAEKKNEDLARKKLTKHKPEVVINTILSKIEKAAQNSDYEPNVDFEDSAEIRELTYPLLKKMFPISQKGMFFDKQLLPENIMRYFEVLDN